MLLSLGSRFSISSLGIKPLSKAGRKNATKVVAAACIPGVSALISTSRPSKKPKLSSHPGESVEGQRIRI